MEPENTRDNLAVMLSNPRDRLLRGIIALSIPSYRRNVKADDIFHSKDTLSTSGSELGANDEPRPSDTMPASAPPLNQDVEADDIILVADDRPTSPRPTADNSHQGAAPNVGANMFDHDSRYPCLEDVVVVVPSSPDSSSDFSSDTSPLPSPRAFRFSASSVPPSPSHHNSGPSRPRSPSPSQTPPAREPHSSYWDPMNSPRPTFTSRHRSVRGVGVYFTSHQRAALMSAFRVNPYVGAARHHTLAALLRTTPDDVREFFRREREKLWRAMSRDGQHEAMARLRASYRVRLSGGIPLSDLSDNQLGTDLHTPNMGPVFP